MEKALQFKEILFNISHFPLKKPSRIRLQRLKILLRKPLNKPGFLASIGSRLRNTIKSWKGKERISSKETAAILKSQASGEEATNAYMKEAFKNDLNTILNLEDINQK